MGDLEPRNVWKTGKNTRLLSLPLDWAESLSNEQVYMCRVKAGSDEMLVLKKSDRIPEPTSGTSFKRDSGYTTSKKPYVELAYDIIGAYLNGHERLYIKIPEGEKEAFQKVDEVSKKLKAISRPLSTTEVGLKFSTSANPTMGVLERMYDVSKQMHQIITDTLNKKLPIDAKELNAIYDLNVKPLEEDADSTCFYARRLFNHALDNPELLARIKVSKPSEVTFYYTAAIDLEQAIDHQRHIFRGVNVLNNRILNPSAKDKEGKVEYGKLGYPRLKNYYQNVYRFFQTAYEGFEVRDKALEVLMTKDDETQDKELVNVSYLGAFVSAVERLDVLRFVNGSEEPWRGYVNSLSYLQSEIWGLADTAKSLAEAALNRYSPPVIPEDKIKFFI